MVKESSVAIIGAGSVGATIAYAMLLRRVSSRILLVDIAPEIVHGQVLDLSDAAFLSSTQVRGGTYEEAGQCDIIVITAGAKQNPGETRTQLISRNHKILSSVFTSLGQLNPNVILLIVANPVDVLTHIAQKLSGLPHRQVFGSGTFLDSGRLRLFLSNVLQVSETAVHSYVLGEHGDSQFIAWSSARLAGKPLLDFPAIQLLDRDEVGRQIAGKANEIIKLKGATYFGIGACVSSLCEAILLNQRHVRPLSVWVERLGCTISMPAVLGSKGIEEIFEVPLNEEEEQKLQQSVKTLKDICDQYSSKTCSAMRLIHKPLPMSDRERINHGPTLVIHGGAGTILREHFPSEEQEHYLEELRAALRDGFRILEAGGTAVDAVEAAVRHMEGGFARLFVSLVNDSPLFNAGKGAVYTIGGHIELEASLMDGSNHRASACALLQHIRNPITLTKTMLITTPTVPHVFLGGTEAESFARSKGLEFVDQRYFYTARRWKQHIDGLEHPPSDPESEGTMYSGEPVDRDHDPNPLGTVGAVAVDQYGNIATATSTGGRNNKWDGRIGDTPLIGSGTWAENETCGVSGTGNGEFFIRYAACHDVASRMRYLGESVQEAAAAVVEGLRKVEGEGGVVAVDRYGEGKS
ncbi:nucleophile aminohydrolase [Endogone sp. FLAS-F59071]|nr:nucleophile aminohydrolase [Endogone sp. FLAS-F59071]|eukprot:RUS20775.1 nucleophile aminohydrolase [Endogone sp. FLAS-F59071]